MRLYPRDRARWSLVFLERLYLAAGFQGEKQKLPSLLKPASYGQNKSHVHPDSWGRS